MRFAKCPCIIVRESFAALVLCIWMAVSILLVLALAQDQQRNLARGSGAMGSQSSTFDNNGAENAIDGNTSRSSRAETSIWNQSW